MTSHPERQKVVQYIGEAMQAGARKEEACEEIGISIRSLQRRTKVGEGKAGVKS